MKRIIVIGCPGSGKTTFSEKLRDGNYFRTLECRIKASDTIFLFDLPTKVCIEGATSRLGKTRYDVPWIDTELDPDFRKQIETFPTTILPSIYELLDIYKENKQIIIFKSRQEADEYLECIYPKQ